MKNTTPLSKKIIWSYVQERENIRFVWLYILMQKLNFLLGITMVFLTLIFLCYLIFRKTNGI